MVAPDDPRAERTPDERRDDHATIDRLAGDLLPALVAKLAASSLGEVDVREGAWRVRLRIPGDGRVARRTAPARAGRRPELRPAPHPDGSAPAADAQAPDPAPAPGDAPPLPSEPAAATAAAGPTRAVATSPAVGFFRPQPDLPAGARVRAGDRIASIDVLGVAREVVAPADGLVGATLVDAGAPVEYGQEVVEIEILDGPAGERGEAG